MRRHAAGPTGICECRLRVRVGLGGPVTVPRRSAGLGLGLGLGGLGGATVAPSAPARECPCGVPPPPRPPARPARPRAGGAGSQASGAPAGPRVRPRGARRLRDRGPGIAPDPPARPTPRRWHDPESPARASGTQCQWPSALAPAAEGPATAVRTATHAGESWLRRTRTCGASGTWRPPARSRHWQAQAGAERGAAAHGRLQLEREGPGRSALKKRHRRLVEGLHVHRRSKRRRTCHFYELSGLPDQIGGVVGHQS